MRKTLGKMLGKMLEQNSALESGFFLPRKKCSKNVNIFNCFSLLFAKAFYSGNFYAYIVK